VSESEQGKSPDNPWPVRAVATRVAKYIDRLGTVWIEGQLTELKLRQSTAWMVLRDPAADMSLSVSCPRDLVINAPVPLAEGTQVIMLGKPQFYTRNGSFSLRISEIPVRSPPQATHPVPAQYGRLDHGSRVGRRT
jgi:exodeoxyribonuclease VII large subunit